MVYQPAMRESCDGRIARMFSEVVTAESWDGVGTTVMDGTHKAQEGASGWVRCSHYGETSVGMLQAR
jgi:hypothetical protein